MIGRTLAHYEVTAFVGKGGMGEVYRARDTKLDREVALKLLPKEMSGDPERAARFGREARTLASLNHPNIAQIYGIENVEGIRFLAMEFVEGEDLAERLRRGAIEVDEAVEIAAAIAAGLEAAHRNGVVHRDLKPANVKITPEGEVKILDFGLARAYAGEEVSESDPALSPTITQAMTMAGTILGSAGYMSPEQARGRRVDKRADLWAFGVILFEMLGGEKVFDAGTTTDTLAAVLRAEIEFANLPANTPPHVVRVLRRCLQRDPELRQRDAGDARLDLLEGDSSRELLAESDAASAGAWKRLLPLGIALGLLIGAAMVWFGRPVPDAVPSGDWKAVVLDGPFFVNPGSAALRPDGRQLIYAQSGLEEPLMLLDLDGSRPHPISGTEGAYGPAYSPDGENIVYATPDGVYRSRADGGGRRQLSRRNEEIASFVWAESDTIYSTLVSLAQSQSEGVIALPASGGKERVVSRPDPSKGELGQFLTGILPGARHGLMTVFGSGSGAYQVHTLDLVTGKSLPVAELRGLARWSSTGHILSSDMNQDALVAIPFAPDALEVTGPSISVIQGIGMPDVSAFGFNVSAEGTLIYGRASISTSDDDQRAVVRLGADGFEPLEKLEMGPWAQPRVSPDGRRILIRRISSENCDLWTFDLRSGAAARVTFEGDDHDPYWLPDGRLAYVERNDAGQVIKLFDHVPGPERELPIPDGTSARITDVTPDGRRLIIDRGGGPDTERGIYLMGLEPGDEPQAWLARETEDTGAKISPDGSWVAHASRVEGRRNVYLRRFDDVETVLQVSVGAGNHPFWSHDGTTLYFEQGDVLMACEISTEGELRLSPPREIAVGIDSNYESGQFEASAIGVIGVRADQDALQKENLTVLLDLEARLRQGR